MSSSARVPIPARRPAARPPAPAPNGGRLNAPADDASTGDTASGNTTPPAASSTFWQTLSAIAWAFFGVRRRRDFENDVQRLNPVHVIMAGIGGAALFVVLLMLLVRWVVTSGVAG